MTAQAADEEPKQPNVLFIMADDLGWRDTAVYGSTFYETPHIDALAERGMRFTDAYAANPLCSPTRASILTGQYPLRHGLTTAAGHIPKLQKHTERHIGPQEIRGLGPAALNFLDSNHYTLGKAMKDAGYATGFFGKWHMGCRKEHWPESHGFDYVKGGRQHPGPPGKNPKRKFYPPWNCDTLKPFPSDDIHVDDFIADLAIEYMKEQHQKKTPFFVCYWAYSVHAPFQSKPELIEKWKKKVDPKNPQHSPTMAAMIQVLDDNVGRLMNALKENGLDDNTIVVFTSDNGGNMYNTVDDTTPTNNAPLKSGKGNNYEGGVRIPLIVRWPGTTKPGSVSNDVVSTVDHYPALLEMTGQTLKPDHHKDGVSYVPALQGKPFDRGPTICDMPHPVWATYNIPNTFVRMGDWKMYRFWYDRDMSKETAPKALEHRYELYNLRDDIGETNNLADVKKDQLKRMADALDAYYEETGVLGYNTNNAYNTRSVGTWFSSSAHGNIVANDGALVITADKPGFAVRNRFLPPGGRDGFIIFQARSSTGATIRLAGRGKPAKPIVLTKTWKTYEVSGKQVSLNSNTFSLTVVSRGNVEVRDVRITTKDKTEMMRYKFY